ncbi:MAG TPA: hypothetical protein VHQ65_11825 [Thermoanaerobaculia bacterium]|nr:hypothetical protein [Thermoanaerobaculia bacterium]
MIRRSFVPFLAAFLLLVSLPAAADATARTAGSQTLAAALDAACQQAASGCLVSGLERRELTPGVAEYSVRLKVGAGPYEEIGLHRVVAESAPWVPARAERAVLLAHGDAWGFRAAFFAGLAQPGPQTLPVFLAQRGVDVWGIDLRWTLVPAAETDLSFMADWGFATDRSDLRVALATARLVRGLTGSGFGRLNLLGWSRGAQLGYLYVADEAARPAWQRHVSGFIPVDVYLKTDDETLRQNACLRAAGQQAILAGGTPADATGALLNTLGLLATADPAGASPVVPGLTNHQVALLAGGATFTFFPPGLEPVPAYHFTGAAWDPTLGLPTALLYTPEATWISSLLATSPYEPVKLLAEAEALVCDLEDLPLDDHLGAVTVPVLYVGAGGGFGDYGVHTTTLLASTDVTIHTASVVPPEARLVDFGHADLFQATDAPALVFQPILDWIAAH